VEKWLDIQAGAQLGGLFSQHAKSI